MKTGTAQVVAEALSDNKKITLLYFSAAWCGPCKAIAPKLAKMEQEYSDITFVKVDVDSERELAAQHEVKSIPTIFVKQGDLSTRFVGGKLNEIRELFNKAATYPKGWYAEIEGYSADTDGFVGGTIKPRYRREAINE